MPSAARTVNGTSGLLREGGQEARHAAHQVHLPVQRSLPDRLVLLPKEGAVHRVQGPGGQNPTPAQAALHETFRALGHPVDVIDSREGVTDWLAKAIRSTDLLGA